MEDSPLLHFMVICLESLRNCHVSPFSSWKGSVSLWLCQLLPPAQPGLAFKLNK